MRGCDVQEYIYCVSTTTLTNQSKEADGKKKLETSGARREAGRSKWLKINMSS